MLFPLIKLAKKLKGNNSNLDTPAPSLFPLIKLAKKLKDYCAGIKIQYPNKPFPLIKLAKKLKATCTGKASLSEE